MVVSRWWTGVGAMAMLSQQHATDTSFLKFESSSRGQVVNNDIRKVTTTIRCHRQTAIIRTALSTTHSQNQNFFMAMPCCAVQLQLVRSHDHAHLLIPAPTTSDPKR